jgi:hypothetical protein
MERESLKKWKSWSQSGDLFTPGNNPPNNSGPVRCTADFDDPGFYTVQCDINPPSVPVATTGGDGGGIIPVAIQNLVTVPALVQAEVIWKNRGNNVRRLISVSQGSSISGFGEGCDVTIQDVTPANAGLGYTNPVKYTGTISIAKGVRGVTEQPPILLAFPGLEAIVSEIPFVVPIPRNCGIISFRAYMVSETAGVAINMKILAEDGYNVIRRYDAVACNGGFVPLPPNAIQLEFDNNDNDHTTDLALDWGIEG